MQEGITEMRALGLHPSVATFVLLIEAYAAEGDIDGAHSAFDSLKKEGMRPDAAAWNALLKAHANIGDLSTLGQAFQLMVDQAEKGAGPSPEDSTYAVCFEGIAAAARRHGETIHHSGSHTSDRAGTLGEERREMSLEVESNFAHSPSFLSDRESASALLDTIEKEMRGRKNGKLGYNSVATAALIKAHGALGHAQVVWNLLLEEYTHTAKDHGNTNIKPIQSSTRNQSSFDKGSSSPSSSSGGVGVGGNNKQHPQQIRGNNTNSTTSTSSSLPLQPPLLFGGKSSSNNIRGSSSAITAASASDSTSSGSGFNKRENMNIAQLDNELLRSLTEAIHKNPNQISSSFFSNNKFSPRNSSSSQQQNDFQQQNQPQQQQRYSSSPRALNAGIPILFRAGKLEGVIYLLRLLRTHGTTIPDSDTYAALITACTVPLRYTLARRLLTHMHDESGIKPCARVFAALLRVECVRGGVEGAVDIIDEMRNAGIVPDAGTWAALRGCAQSHGRADIAEYAQRELIAAQEGGVPIGGNSVAIASATVAGGVLVESMLEGGKIGILESVTGDGDSSDTGDGAIGDKERHWKGYYASDEDEEW